MEIVSGRKKDPNKGQERSARSLLCRASFFSGCNNYSPRAYCTKESTCYQKLSHLLVPAQACFLVPPGKSQARRNGRNRKCFVTAEGKSLEYREYRLDVSPDYQNLYCSIIIFQEDSLQLLSRDQQMAQDLDDGTLIAVSESLLLQGDTKVKFHWCTAHHYLFPTNLSICNLRPSACAKCKEKRLQKQSNPEGSTRKRKFDTSSVRGHDEISGQTLPSRKRGNLVQDLASSLLHSLNPNSYPDPNSALSEQISMLLSAAQPAFQTKSDPLRYSNATPDQLVSSINRVCSSSVGLFDNSNRFSGLSNTSPADLVSMISQSCQLHIPTPRYPPRAISRNFRLNPSWN